MQNTMECKRIVKHRQVCRPVNFNQNCKRPIALLKLVVCDFYITANTKLDFDDFTRFCDMYNFGVAGDPSALRPVFEAFDKSMCKTLV